ncbi:caspase family protein [Phaeacidiphilus oryzae]|uniref:caspase family protein n=1 Tax=Phaeacidiphilus oryzae TaxID=348818 RepID=UPI000A04A800|nr:caspase family protein [Phaeacidiphilus oryzae]
MKGLPEAAASRAVLIGVSRYKTLPALPAVANNLPAFAEVLTSPDSWGLPEEHCVLVPEPSTADEMLDPIEVAASRARDTLLVYFAGHGLTVGSRGDLLLGLPGSRPGRSHTGVRYEELRELILGGRAERQVVLLDCCFSGRALGMMGDSSGLIADQAQIEGSYLLAAAAENENALAEPGEAHTAFTGALLDVLRRGIPDAGPWLALDDLYHSLADSLRAKGRPEPQKRDRNTAGRLLFVRNRAYHPPSRPPLLSGDEPPWPDPSGLCTPEEFLHALAVVRSLSRLSLQEVGERARPPMAATTVSNLLRRTELPARWNTTARYLAACGLSTGEIARWHESWTSLRSAAPRPPSPLTPKSTEDSGQRRRWQLPLRRHPKTR